MADTQLIGVDVDPVAAILARGHLAAAGFADRARFCYWTIGPFACPRLRGRHCTLATLHMFVITRYLLNGKRGSLSRLPRGAFRRASSAGLHVHFFLATARHGATRGFRDVHYERRMAGRQLRQSGSRIAPRWSRRPGRARAGAQDRRVRRRCDYGAITSFVIGSRPARFA